MKNIGGYKISGTCPATNKVYAIIPLALIQVAGYQRKPDEKHVNRIKANWKDYIAATPKVSYRDGKFWVYEGQHTVIALIQREESHAMVEIFTLDYQTEAAAFWYFNTGRKRLSGRDNVKAGYMADIPHVRKVVNALKKAGISTYIDAAAGMKDFAPLSVLLKLAENEIGLRKVKRTIKVMAAGWGEYLQSDMNCVKHETVRVLVDLVGNSKLSDDVLAERLNVLRPSLLRDKVMKKNPTSNGSKMSDTVIREVLGTYLGTEPTSILHRTLKLKKVKVTATYKAA